MKYDSIQRPFFHCTPHFNHLGYEGLSYRKVHAYCTGESAPPMEFLVMLGELGFDLPPLALTQLSDQERLIIEHLRTQPEKQAIVLAKRHYQGARTL
jgi:hypothetical protein